MPGATGQRGGGGSRHEALGAPLRIGVELGGALERAGRGGVAPRLAAWSAVRAS